MISAIYMGRYYYSKKEEADGLKKIQMWWLKKYGYLQGGWKAGGIKWTNSWTGKETNINFYINISEADNYIQLFYTQTRYSSEEKKDFDYKIPIVSTFCYFGGVRYWFKCNFLSNGMYCGRRVGMLYLGGKYFACRHCYNLSYQSRNENRRYRDYALFYVLGNRMKIEKLEEKIKRRFYNGKPTRKQKTVDRMRKREFPYALEVMNMDIYKKKQLTK